MRACRRPLIYVAARRLLRSDSFVFDELGAFFLRREEVEIDCSGRSGAGLVYVDVSCGILLDVARSNRVHVNACRRPQGVLQGMELFWRPWTAHAASVGIVHSIPLVL